MARRAGSAGRAPQLPGHHVDVRPARAGRLLQYGVPWQGLADTVNDAPGVWAALLRIQVQPGMIPRTMILRPVTGLGTQFRVTLARAQQIFAGAYAGVSGLARTVRGPAMRDERGPRRPAELMASGLCGAGQDRSALS